MKSIPETQASLVLRTDFSDDTLWTALCGSIRVSAGHNRLTFINDSQYDGVSVEQVLTLVPPFHTFMFIVDHVTTTDAKHPILVVDLRDKTKGNTFRVSPPASGEVENNLSISNMDFEDFSENVDENGIFWGF